MNKSATIGVVLLLVSGFGCKHTHDLSPSERQQAREREVASFAQANGATPVPDITEDAVTLDWQTALPGPHKIVAFLGSVDDIFEKDAKYYLRVSDIDHKLLWIVECSELEANQIRGQRDKALEDLIVVQVGDIRPMVSEDSITEISGTLRKFQLSNAPP